MIGAKKNILTMMVDARTMGSCPSGIGIYLYDFIRELQKNRSFRLILITDVAESDQIRSLMEKRIPVLCYGRKVFRSAGIFSYFRFVQKKLRKEQPALFWEPNNMFPVHIKGYNGKIILTVHDLFPLVKPQYFSLIYRLYFKHGIRLSIKQADAILFNSLETEQQTLKKFPISKQKRRFISYLIVQKPPTRLLSDSGFFLYIGNLERRKGSDLLLKAYQRYSEQGGIRPLYIGGNIRDKSIRELLMQLQKKNKGLHYMGYLNEEEKYDLLSRCFCFLFPSRAEGFGIPPLEAASYGKPLITSDLSIFKEILPFPVQTFSLKKGEAEQIDSLCQLMLEEKFVPYPYEDSAHVLERYKGEYLSKRLAAFFKEITKWNA